MIDPPVKLANPGTRELETLLLKHCSTIAVEVALHQSTAAIHTDNAGLKCLDRTANQCGHCNTRSLDISLYTKSDRCRPVSPNFLQLAGTCRWQHLIGLVCCGVCHREHCAIRLSYHADAHAVLPPLFACVTTVQPQAHGLLSAAQRSGAALGTPRG